MWRDAWWALGFAGLFAMITVALALGGPLIDVDLAVAGWAADHRPPAADVAGRLLNRLGQGGALLTLAVLTAGWLAVVRRRAGDDRWRAAWPLGYVAAAGLLVVPVVLGIKQVTERGAPSSPLPMTQTVPLFGRLPPGEYAAAYPGGHAVNAVVWYGVLLALVTALARAYGRAGPPRPLRVVIRVAPPVIVLATTTYLNFHWLSDSLAGLALGLAIDRVLALLPAPEPAPG